MESEVARRLVCALRDVEDPELSVNIVDLGLILDVRHDGETVDIKMTFTAMGCPALDMIIDDIRERLMREPDVGEVRVDVVWYPGWSKDRMTEEGKAQMREMGISV